MEALLEVWDFFKMICMVALILAAIQIPWNMLWDIILLRRWSKDNTDDQFFTISFICVFVFGLLGVMDLTLLISQL